MKNEVPSVLARRYYEKHHPDMFNYVVEQHFLNGYVRSSPICFCLFRPVNVHSPDEVILDIKHTFHKPQQNCWFIFLFTGNLKEVFTILPFRLPYCAYEHNSAIRRFETDYISNKITGKVHTWDQ